MYVTLEPCCHYGKTPPCTEAIIESGISEVVVGCLDPNPLVAGKGVYALRSHGIKVTTGVLEEECINLNDVFFHYITHKTPYVAMKYAMTVDGKIATAAGKSKWITGEAARTHVHRLRHQYSAIMVGIGTVIADDPMLTCRLPDCKNPLRVICDTHLRISMASNIVKTAREVKTYIATGCADNEKADGLRGSGCEIITIPKKGEHVDLKTLMTRLGNLNIDSILLEGGAALFASALEDSIVNKVYAYVAPKIFGGAAAKTAVGGKGVDSPDDAYRLKNSGITLLGDDILLEYSLK
jgi:diaminohydroxyphosphoribosylaminopyrimidine deaminase/5-amino-6-(5-phosphoribosylamino)uracil reductase